MTRTSLILVNRGLNAATITTMVLVQACSASTAALAMLTEPTQPAPLWFDSSSNLINCIIKSHKYFK